MKSTTKQQRKYSQDFSGNSKTDESFAAACDVNNIVRHYQATGIDPSAPRKALERFADATEITYDEAMRQVAEIDSAFALLPPQEREQHDNNPALWLESLDAPPPPDEAPEPPADPPAKPAPSPPKEDATDADREHKVQ